MPGWTNSTNLYGPSDFFVGNVLGDGVNYTSIQTAINEALALGNDATIYIRPGNYSESLQLEDNIDLVGCTTTGQSAQVRIDGLLTVPLAGSCAVRNIQFTDGGNVHTVLANGGGTVTFFDCTISNANNATFAMQTSDVVLNRCQVNATNDAFEYTVGAGIVRMFGTRVDAGNYVADMQTGGSFFADTCILVSGGAGVVFDTAGANIEISRSQLIAAAAPAIDMQVGGTCVLNYNNISSPNQAISFNAVGPVVRSYQNSYVIGGGPEYVVGPGQYEYASDVVNPVTAQGIDGATVQVKYAWRPWAEGAAAPGLFSTKGTCSFDSAQFDVVDGFIQLGSTAVATQYVTDTGTVLPVANSINVFGGPGVTVTGAGDTITVNSVVWSDVGVNQLVDIDEGSFATAGVTLTLPAAPTIGEECRFVVATGGSLTIQANAGQTINIGNQASSVAGTASSTATGDCLILVAQSATTWWAVSMIGNFTLA